MKTSDAIKKYLMLHNSGTVAQLSHALDLTKVDIHYHIRKLLSNGSIRVSMINPPHGQGRPARRFELNEAPPLQLTRTVVSLLQNSPPSTSTGIIALADRIAQQILDCCPSTTAVSLSPTVRLNKIFDELQELGFILTWQAGRKGPQILLHHEPISLLIQDNNLAHEVIQALIDHIRKKNA